MSSMTNNVQLFGRLGKDVELTKFDSGKVKARVSVATTEDFISQAGDRKSVTTWHNVEAWGKTAENMSSLLRKGSRVFIDGALDYHTYEDKDGVEKNYTVIKTARFLKLDKKESDENAEIEDSVAAMIS